MRGLRGLVLCFVVGLALAGPPQAGWAQTAQANDIVAQPYVLSLKAEGYGGISVSTSWLGRIRIVAWLDGTKREIVLHPTSGEVLRDVMEPPETQMAEDSGRDAPPTVPTRTGTAVAGTVAAISVGAALPADGTTGDTDSDAPEAQPWPDDGDYILQDTE